jgi:hypothetical protein
MKERAFPASQEKDQEELALGCGFSFLFILATFFLTWKICLFDNFLWRTVHHDPKRNWSADVSPLRLF